MVLERWSNGKTSAPHRPEKISLNSRIGHYSHVRFVNPFCVLDKTSILRGISNHPYWVIHPRFVNNAWVGSRHY